LLSCLSTFVWRFAADLSFDHIQFGDPDAALGWSAPSVAPRAYRRTCIARAPSMRLRGSFRLRIKH
jgi:hypothetical protein